MDIYVALLVLFAAAMHAGWNALVKVGGDRLMVMMAVTLFGSLVSLAALPFVPIPAVASWRLLALSIVLHTIYHFVLPAAYDRGDLGQVYPIARGSAPLMASIGAFAVAGETISGLALIGVACLAAGVMALTFDCKYRLDRNPKAAIFALGTGAIIAAYTVVDGLGARQAGNALGYAVWLTAADGLLTFALVLVWRGRGVLRAASEHVGPALAGGAMQVGLYWIIVWALTVAPISMVSGLRETSVLFAAIASTFLLKEGFGVWRFVSAAMVTAGLLMVGRSRQ